MANFNHDIEVSKLWNSVGTYSIYVPQESKNIVETYWRYLLEGLGGLYFDLAQYSLIPRLAYSPGYINFSDKEILVDFNSIDVVYLDPPAWSVRGDVADRHDVPGTTQYTYRIIALNFYGETIASTPISYAKTASLSSSPNVLAWESVAGATSYKIYGRVPGSEGLLGTVASTSPRTFSDNGSVTTPGATFPKVNTAISYYLYTMQEQYIIHLPKMVGRVTGVELTYGTHYTIVNGNQIKFYDVTSLFAANADIQKEIFDIEDMYLLNPLLPNLYYQALGETNDPFSIFTNTSPTYYVPTYISEYSGLSTVEQIKLKARHHIMLVNAVTNLLIKGATIGNLRKALSLLYNVPFCYEGGLVGSVSHPTGYHTFSIGTVNYKIPNTLTLSSSIVQGQTVNKYDLLTTGVSIHDYISDESLVISLANQNNPYEKYFILAIDIPTAISNLGYNATFINFFMSNIIPPNLKVVDY